MCGSSKAMPLPVDLDLPTDGYRLPSAACWTQGLAVPECSRLLLEHCRDSLQDRRLIASSSSATCHA